MDINKAKRIVSTFFKNELGLDPDVSQSTNDFFTLATGAHFEGFYCDTLFSVGCDKNGLLQLTVLLGEIIKPTFDIYHLINEYNNSSQVNSGLCFHAFLTDNQLSLVTEIPFVNTNMLNQYLDFLFDLIEYSLSKNPIMEELCSYIVKK